MGQVTVDAMKEAFGTKPEDLIACVGPSMMNFPVFLVLVLMPLQMAVLLVIMQKL